LQVRLDNPKPKREIYLLQGFWAGKGGGAPREDKANKMMGAEF